MIHLEENNAKTHVSWSFYDDHREYPSIDALQKGTAKPPFEILTDIEALLEILNDADLLYPTYFFSTEKFEIQSSSVHDFCAQMWAIVSQQNGLLSIDKIGGFGTIISGNEEILKVEDLLTLEDVRFCNRQFQIKTSYSFWWPLTMNPNLPKIWQPEIALLNAPRLKKTIQKIHETSETEIEPGLNEVDTEKSIWIKNYQLFVSPELLHEALLEMEPKPNFDLEPFEIKS